MSQGEYIGMDVHQATISVALMDAHRKLIMECLLETKAGTIVEFIQGLLVGEKSRLNSLRQRRGKGLHRGSMSENACGC
jgi:hypothetical protein